MYNIERNTTIGIDTIHRGTLISCIFYLKSMIKRNKYFYKKIKFLDDQSGFKCISLYSPINKTYRILKD